MRIKILLLFLACIVFLSACKKSDNATVDKDTNSNKILFIAQVDNGQFNNTNNLQIFVVNPDGSALTQLTNFTGKITADNQVLSVAWSPDHSKITYNKEYKIYVMDADGNNVVKLTDDTTISLYGEFSPDGKKIAYLTQINMPSPGAPNIFTTQITVMDAATGANKTQIINLHTSTYNYLDVNFCTWSPDGTKLSFIGTSQNLNFSQISTVDITGTIVTPVVSFNTYSPLCLKYSPDGYSLMFQNFGTTSSSTYGAYTMSSNNGTNLKLLFSNLPTYKPGSTLIGSSSYSPNGTQIVSGSFKDNPNGDLYIVNADGTIANRVTNKGFSQIGNTAWR
ncbi:hypothetical protein ACFGVR_17460 [Mucilaginibacter sp. AW1-3]